MARARPEERILDSGASAHMTGIKSLLKWNKACSYAGLDEVLEAK
jgi:hypothetical protein